MSYTPIVQRFESCTISKGSRWPTGRMRGYSPFLSFGNTFQRCPPDRRIPGRWREPPVGDSQETQGLRADTLAIVPAFQALGSYTSAFRGLTAPALDLSALPGRNPTITTSQIPRATFPTKCEYAPTSFPRAVNGVILPPWPIHCFALYNLPRRGDRVTVSM